MIPVYEYSLSDARENARLKPKNTKKGKNIKGKTKEDKKAKR